MECVTCQNNLAAAGCLCFYVKSEREVHLIFKPECRMLLKRTMEIQDPGKKKAKITCGGCGSNVGSDLPFGPNGTSFAAFATDSVVVLGTPLGRKQKWAEESKKSQFSDIARRNDDDFFGDAQVDSTPTKRARAQQAAPISFATQVQHFAWDVTETSPKSYQIEAYVEALARDLLVVMPTGCGKTLVAAMVLARMARLNRNHMGLFVVDRIPLVFQQASAIAAETGLRTCQLCGENKTKGMLHKLRDGGFDVLVVTGGALVEILRNEELSLQQFSVVIVDEAHHATGEHVYSKVLSAVRNLPGTPDQPRPRLLGLTASPVTATTANMAFSRLQGLRAAFGAATALPNQQSTQWLVVDSTPEQRQAVQCLVACVQQGTSMHRELEVDVDAETLMQDPGALGRLRGLLRSAEDALRLKRSGSSKALDDIRCMQQVVVAIEVCLTLGPCDGKEFLTQLIACPDWLAKALRSFPQSSRSPQLEQLLARVKAMPSESRIIVFVDTRVAAHRLCKALASDLEVADRFKPEVVCGHGGFDGMDWHGGQDVALAAFADGDVRLLVSTSVLEEGLDVAACDLVVRFQGVGSLISLVQSRGRARKANSRLIVILPSEMRRRVLEMAERERLMDSVLQQATMQDRVPSQVSMDRIQQLKGQSASPGPSSSNCARWETWETCERTLVKMLCFGATDVNDLISSLDCAALGLQVQRGEVLKDSAAAIGTPGIAGTDDVVVLLSCKNLWRSQKCSSRTLYQNICHGWDFSLPAGTNGVWMQKVEPAPSRHSVNLCRGTGQVRLGRFLDRKTFAEQFLIAEHAEVNFAHRGSVEIFCDWRMQNITETLSICVDARSLAGFGLVSWGKAEGVATLYLPMTSVPRVSVGEERPQRLSGFDHPLLAAFSQNFVIAIAFPLDGAAEAQDLRRLLHEPQALPVPTFDTHIVDVQIEHRFDLAKPLPCLNAEQPLARECHWSLGVLSTCAALSPDSQKAIVERCCEAVDDRLGSLNPMLGWDQQVVAATSAVYAVVRACESSYWADCKLIFQSALEAWKGMTQEEFEKLHQPAPENHVMLKRALVTPSRLRLLPPAPVRSSRLLRRFPDASFLAVHFVEEQMQKLQGTDTLPHIKQVMARGIVIGGKTFRYLGCSASQLRQQSAMFVEAESIEEVRRLRNAIVANGESFTSIAKYSSRLGLYFTADTPTLMIRPDEVSLGNDIAASNGSSFTDGAGKMPYKVGKEVAVSLGLQSVPCAFQFRWAGLKGVALVVPDDDHELLSTDCRTRLLCRPSMRKFECKDHAFCVVSIAEHHPVHLNREIITLLMSLQAFGQWDVCAGLVRRQEEALQHAAGCFTSQEQAAQELDSRLVSELKQMVPTAARETGLIDEPFWVSLLAKSYRIQVRDLATKARIPIPRSEGCLLLGVPDPVGVLKEGEVFVQCAYEEGGASTDFVVEAKVLVYRNPCLHPGDIQHLRAVDKEELRFLSNVLVLPVTGKRSVAACCSGGDLDGDKFSVIWAPDLVPPLELMQPALDYDALLREAGGPMEVRPATFSEEGLADFFCDVVSNDTLGKIAHLHLAYCDNSPQGALDPLAIELAKGQSLAVDFPKTGIPPQVPEDTILEVKKQGYPDFMQKLEKDTYTSEKVLGILFRRCTSLDADFQALTSVDIDHTLLLPGRASWAKSAVRALANFRRDLDQLLISHGLRDEAEACLATALRWPPTADRGKASLQIKAHLEHLLRKHRSVFFMDLPESQHKQKASAWYEAAYALESQKGASSCRTFAWIVGDILCDIKAGCAKDEPSSAGVNRTVGQTAREALLEKLSSLHEITALRMSVSDAIQHALDACCSKKVGKELSPSVFSVHVFGSTALGFCEAQSDLDLCVIAEAAAHQPPFVPEALLATFAGLDETSQARHFLQTVISPAVDDLAMRKEEVMTSQVPLVRLVVASSLDAEEVRVDITFNPDGLSKTRYFQGLQADFVRFGMGILLSSWARSSGLVRSHSQADGYQTAAPLIPVQWQAVVLHVSKHLGRCSPEAPSAKPGPALRSLQDSLSQMTGTDSASFGVQIFNFLRALTDLQGEIAFTWPIAGSPQHHISGEVVSMIRDRANRTLEVLATTRSFAAACVAASARNKTAITRQLSRALSFKLQGHFDFHEAYLKAASAALVKFEEINGSDRVLMHASGSAAQIVQLQRELQRYVSAARAIGMPATKASRYFMEGSTRLFFQGASCPSARVRFQTWLGSHLPSHAACERMLPVLNTREPTCYAWEAVAEARFLDLWSTQMAKLPTESRGHMESLSVRVRFGTCYLTDVLDKLPETAMTLSISELEEALVKHRRNRKTCVRGPPDTLPPKSEPNSKQMKMIVIPPSTGSLLAGQKSRKQRKKRLVGVGASFSPGLLPGNASSHLQQRCLELCMEALQKAGFESVSADNVEAGWSLSIAASQAYELNVKLASDLRPTRVCERGLCWLHATIFGSGDRLKADEQDLVASHDVRVKIETADSLPADSQLLEKIAGGNVALLDVQNQTPAPAKKASRWLQDHIMFARRVDERYDFCRSDSTCSFPFHAEVAVGSEFMGRELKLRRDFCELSIRADDAAQSALRQGAAKTRAFGEEVWKVARLVSAALESLQES
ncbi:unnamed protein product [Effrenium voratum]|nr:unnamed protein product [Effrenium voratum]